MHNEDWHFFPVYNVVNIQVFITDGIAEDFNITPRKFITAIGKGNVILWNWIANSANSPRTFLEYLETGELALIPKFD